VGFGARKAVVPTAELKVSTIQFYLLSPQFHGAIMSNIKLDTLTKLTLKPTKNWGTFPVDLRFELDKFRQLRSG